MPSSTRMRTCWPGCTVRRAQGQAHDWVHAAACCQLLLSGYHKRAGMGGNRGCSTATVAGTLLLPGCLILKCCRADACRPAANAPDEERTSGCTATTCLVRKDLVRPPCCTGNGSCRARCPCCCHSGAPALTLPAYFLQNCCFHVSAVLSFPPAHPPC